jgi:hypothetical protein
VNRIIGSCFYQERKRCHQNQLEELVNESNQLRAILSKAVATAKGKAKSPLP